MRPSSRWPQIWPEDVTPAPDKETSVGELEASLAKLICPGGLTVVVGAKFTVNGALCPTVSVTGKVMPCRE